MEGSFDPAGHRAELFDESIWRSTVVQRRSQDSNVPAKKGYVREVHANAVVKVLSTNEILTNVDSKDLQPLQKFALGDTVVFDSKVGSITGSSQRLHVVLSNGTKCVIPSTVAVKFGDYDAWRASKKNTPCGIFHVRYQLHHPYQFYPGQILITCPDILKKFSENRGKKKGKKRKSPYHNPVKVLVEKVEYESVSIHWLYSANGEKLPEKRSKIQGEDLEKLNAIANSYQRYLGKRLFYHRKGTEEVIPKEVWRYRTDWRAKGHKKGGPVQLEGKPGMWGKIDTEAEKKEIKKEKKKRKKLAGVVLRKLVSKRLKMRKKRPTIPPNPDSPIVVDTQLVTTTLDVIWEDGSLERDIPAQELTVFGYLETKHFFPGSFVVDNKTGIQRAYGVVQSADNIGRVAKVTWLRSRRTVRDVEPMTLKTEEVSTYDLKSHPTFAFAVGSVAVRRKNSAADGAAAGKVIAVHTDGRVEIAWADGRTTMSWPEDLVPEREWKGAKFMRGCDYKNFDLQMKQRHLMVIDSLVQRLEGLLKTFPDYEDEVLAQNLNEITHLLTSLYEHLCKHDPENGVKELNQTYKSLKSACRIVNQLIVAKEANLQILQPDDWGVSKTKINAWPPGKKIILEIVEKPVTFIEEPDYESIVYKFSDGYQASSLASLTDSIIDVHCACDETGAETPTSDKNSVVPDDSYVYEEKCSESCKKHLEECFCEKCAMDTSELDVTFCVDSSFEICPEAHNGEAVSEQSVHSDDIFLDASGLISKEASGNTTLESTESAEFKDCEKCDECQNDDPNPITDQLHLKNSDELPNGVVCSNVKLYGKGEESKAQSVFARARGRGYSSTSSGGGDHGDVSRDGEKGSGLIPYLDTASAVESLDKNFQSATSANTEKGNRAEDLNDIRKLCATITEQLRSILGEPPHMEKYEFKAKDDVIKAELKQPVCCEYSPHAAKKRRVLQRGSNLSLLQELQAELTLLDELKNKLQHKETEKKSEKDGEASGSQPPSQEGQPSSSKSEPEGPFVPPTRWKATPKKYKKLYSKKKRNIFNNYSKHVDDATVGAVNAQLEAKLNEAAAACAPADGVYKAFTKYYFGFEYAHDAVPKGHEALAKSMEQEKKAVEVEEEDELEASLDARDVWTGGFEILATAPTGHKYKAGVQPTPGEKFIKTVNRELNRLRSALPPGLWVKGYEDRMDLYTVMIRGPEHTPYEDGLFLFDVKLPANYPQAPPLVHYHSFCTERLNPNLYENGKVCLSLLGTWPGKGTENWTSKSTLLQVLVSIQGLILVKEPFYNEPLNDCLVKGSKQANESSRAYNEMAVLLLIQSLTELFKRSHPDFKKEIEDHFNSNAQRLAGRFEKWLDAAEKRAANPSSASDTPSEEDGAVALCVLNENKMAAKDQPFFPLFPASRGFCLSMRNAMKRFLFTVKESRIEN